MENIDKLKNAVLIFEKELEMLEHKLKKDLNVDEKMKIDFRKAEIAQSINNLTKYIKRLEFVEKVKKYENSSRNAQG